MGIFRKSITQDEARDNQPTKIIDKENNGKYKIEEKQVEKNDNPSTPNKKAKMEEIYSTKDKHIRYKNQMPLEAEAREKKQHDTKEGMMKGDVEIKFEDVNEVDDVELKAEIEEGTIVSEEIIEDVGDFSNLKTIYARESTSPVLKYIELDKDEIAELPSLSNAEKVTHTISPYIHESKIENVQLKAGRFTEIVENEYDQYLIYVNPTFSRKHIEEKIPENKSLLYHLSQFANKYKGEQKDVEKRQAVKKEIREHKNRDYDDVKEKKRKNDTNKKITATKVGAKKERKGFFAKIGRFFVILFAMLSSLFVSNKKSTSDYSRQGTSFEKFVSQESVYQDKQSSKFVFGQIKKNIHALIRIGIIELIVLIVFLVLSILESTKGIDLFSGLGAFGPFLYCLINLIVLIFAGIIYREPLISGIKALAKIKGSADSIISVAYIGCLLQCIVSLFFSETFLNGEHHIYAFIVVFAMLMNIVGRIFVELRTKMNFNFITSKKPSYATKTYNNEEIATRMLHGTTARKKFIAYQHKTDFVSDFLKISYAPDPSEEMSGRFAPVVVISSLFVGILYFILSNDFVNAISSVAVMSCVGIPFSALLACNIPLYFLSKKTLKYNSMISGFPTIRQFCDTSAVMVKASDLYPSGSIKLESISGVSSYRVEEILLAAGCVLAEVDSPLVTLFKDKIHKHINELPNVESAVYEDKLGIVGWVNGSRIIIGNRKLMGRYNIDINPNVNDARILRSGKSVTYIAYSGQLIARLVLSYTPNRLLQKQMINAENEGLCFIVSSTDPNLTTEKIASDYMLYKKSIRVLPLGYANVCNECIDTKEDTSRAYLATRGKFISMLRGLTGCIKIKSNITMSLIVEIVGIVLGILLSATMSLYAGVSRLTIFNLFLYIFFWIIATLLTHFIRRP